MALGDDFVMTIDDEDDVVMEEEVIEEETPETKSKSKAAKSDGDQFDNDFTFAMDGGGNHKNNVWDFTAARDMLKPKVCHSR
jgi:ATP-dependent RNA helicase DDX27